MNVIQIIINREELTALEDSNFGIPGATTDIWRIMFGEVPIGYELLISCANKGEFPMWTSYSQEGISFEFGEDKYFTYQFPVEITGSFRLYESGNKDEISFLLIPKENLCSLERTTDTTSAG